MGKHWDARGGPFSKEERGPQHTGKKGGPREIGNGNMICKRATGTRRKESMALSPLTPHYFAHQIENKGCKRLEGRRGVGQKQAELLRGFSDEVGPIEGSSSEE